MDQFVSNYTNRLDAKGRVSVPAPFRAVLAKDGFEGVYCYPSLDAAALDCGGNRLLSTITSLLEGLDPYSDERDLLSTALYGASETLKLDQEGRIILSEGLRAHAGISGEVTFVGLGDKFQMWSPEHFKVRFGEARERVRELRKLLGAKGQQSVASDASSVRASTGARE
jgi:MraZ protein